LRDYDKRLGNVKVGSASLAFRSIEDLDVGVLMELIENASNL
jgi:hypothetical protein